MEFIERSAMKSVYCTVPVRVEGIEEILEKVEKLNALAEEAKTLAQSISEYTVTVNLPTVKEEQL